MDKQKFYQKTWLVILALVFFAPLGVFLMWKYKPWNRTLKIILSVASLLFFIIVAANMQSNPNEADTTPTDTPNAVSPEATPSTTVDFDTDVFTRYVEQDFNTVAVREIVYKPQDGYITIDFDVAEGDYFIAATQEDGEALALYACSKVANLFEHSQGAGLYPDGTEVTFNAYYFGKNVFGFTFDAETIENTKWSEITAVEFETLWTDFYINTD